jgi:release factor glutamine methyltransferase
MTDTAGPPSRRRWLAAAEGALREAGSEDPPFEASLLLARALGEERLQVLAFADEALTVEQAAKAEDWLWRRLQGVPLAYLEGRADFYGRPFRVDPAVLIPRADSECLIDLVLARAELDRPTTVLDLGTGSGCLLLTLLAERPAWRGIGIDRSRAALKVARSNAEALGLGQRASFIQSSWLEAIRLSPEVGLVVANPPYVLPGEELGPGVAGQEPDLALYSAADDALSAYRRILTGCRSWSSEARLLFEIGAGRAMELDQLAAAHGFRRLTEAEDLGGILRALLYAPA